MKTIQRFWYLNLLAGILASCAICLADGETSGLTNPVVSTRSMTGASLLQAIERLAGESGINYIVSPKVSSEGVPLLNFKWTNIAARAALERVLKEHDLALIENPATTVARIEPAALNGKPVDPDLVGNDTNIVNSDFKSTEGSPNTNGVVPVIMMTEAPLNQAVDLLSRESQLSVSFDPQSFGNRAGQDLLSTPVSFSWKNLTARQALVAILDCYDLTLVQSPGSPNVIIKVKTPANSAATLERSDSSPATNPGSAGMSVISTPQLISLIASQLANSGLVILVIVVAIVVAVIRWHEAPRAALFCVIGFGLIGFSILSGMVAYIAIYSKMATDHQAMAGALQIMGVLRQFVTSTGLVMLLVAVFNGRAQMFQVPSIPRAGAKA